MKPQSIRLFDVFLLGPLMIAFALKKQRLSNVQRLALALIGAGTVAYNWHNYRQIEYGETQD